MKTIILTGLLLAGLLAGCKNVGSNARSAPAGGRLLVAAQDYLYYCPVYFAGHATPLYGIIEKLWVPWYGSTERMGLSAVDDKEPIEMLRRRGYQVVRPGDVSMTIQLGSDRPFSLALNHSRAHPEPSSPRRNNSWTRFLGRAACSPSATEPNARSP